MQLQKINHRVFLFGCGMFRFFFSHEGKNTHHLYESNTVLRCSEYTFNAATLTIGRLKSSPSLPLFQMRVQLLFLGIITVAQVLQVLFQHMASGKVAVGREDSGG